ncbi:hypothetical protein O3P69_007506 [Scylla paramamosain]|uniref:Secreted protein n=1 Tax=Scylla paramamosain TaxID=85552 RepID=A0AAW0V3S7_SCYPA
MARVGISMHLRGWRSLWLGSFLHPQFHGSPLSEAHLSFSLTPCVLQVHADIYTRTLYQGWEKGLAYIRFCNS